MKRNEILSVISSLAMSQGLYGRYLRDLMAMPTEEFEAWCEFMESLNFASDLEISLFIDEGQYPAGYQRPAMSDEAIKAELANELAGMIDNNIVRGNGVESFRGWLEDGDALYNKGMNEEEVARAMTLVDELEGAVSEINSILGDF